MPGAGRRNPRGNPHRGLCVQPGDEYNLAGSPTWQPRRRRSQLLCLRSTQSDWYVPEAGTASGSALPNFPTCSLLRPIRKLKFSLVYNANDYIQVYSRTESQVCVDMLDRPSDLRHREDFNLRSLPKLRCYSGKNAGLFPSRIWKLAILLTP